MLLCFQLKSCSLRTVNSVINVLFSASSFISLLIISECLCLYGFQSLLCYHKEAWSLWLLFSMPVWIFPGFNFLTSHLTVTLKSIWSSIELHITISAKQSALDLRNSFPKKERAGMGCGEGGGRESKERCKDEKCYFWTESKLPWHHKSVWDPEVTDSEWDIREAVLK